MFNPLIKAVKNIYLKDVGCVRIHSNLLTFTRKVNNSPQIKNDNLEKILRVCILGVPNAGKSTLINSLINRQVCATSKKVHTTKTAAKAVYIEGNSQIVFVDTPGIVTVGEMNKFKLGHNLLVEPRRSVKNVDMIGVIQDVSNSWTRDFIHPLLIHILKNNSHIPSFLILNKIDVLRSKRKLLDSIRVLCNGLVAGEPIKALKDIRRKLENVEKGYSGFSDVFIISALQGDGVEKIRNYLVNNAKPGKWMFSDNEFTDQTKEKLIEEAVRAKLMDFLPQEIPYKLVPEVEYLDETEEKLVVVLSITCPNERTMKLTAGAGGGKLKQMTDLIRNDLCNMFRKQCVVSVSLRMNQQQEEED